MQLKKRLPKNRSLEQIMNHYLVEKDIAEKLIKSSREERKQVYATMYDDLFDKVPDHPRLIARDDCEVTLTRNKNKLAIFDEYINESTVFAEFGSGDCKLGYEVAKKAQHVYGIDISDQRNPIDRVPKNFDLVVYDGYVLNQIQSNSIDLLFSDQLIEHLHPEDARNHFKLARRILKPGGKYIFRTPHAFSGPHDVSAYFSNEPQCFHLKEWTYGELRSELKAINFTKFEPWWYAKGIKSKLGILYFDCCEKVFQMMPVKFRRFASIYFLPTIVCVVTK